MLFEFCFFFHAAVHLLLTVFWSMHNIPVCFSFSLSFSFSQVVQEEFTMVRSKKKKEKKNIYLIHLLTRTGNVLHFYFSKFFFVFLASFFFLFFVNNNTQEQTSIKKNFNDVASQEEMWQYLEGPFVNNLL